MIGVRTILPKRAFFYGHWKNREFQKLLAGLRYDIRPHGALEEILVEKIAIYYWRPRRVLQSEIGQLERGLDSDNAGPAVVGGMVFTNSGYSHHHGIIPGNVLLAFSAD